MAVMKLLYKQLINNSMKSISHIDRILVPVALNRSMIAPIKQAIFFHEKFGSEIVLLHVESKFPFLQKWLSPMRQIKHKKKVLKKFRNNVNHLFPDFPLNKQVKYEVVIGKLVPSILRVSKRRKSDLIIIKKAKRTSAKAHFLKKENADRLVSYSKCAVLTIFKKPKLEGINHILLPVDITKNTDKKVAWAISIAKEFGASISIVSIQHLEIERVHSLSYNKGRRIEQDIKEHGIDVDLAILKADNRSADQVVLDYTKETKPDLVMIMTHQETILFDNYLGAFAREIIHRSKVPVMSIVPQKDNLLFSFFESFESKAAVHQGF